MCTNKRFIGKELLLSLLGSKPTSKNKVTVRCPSHKDSSPSLSVKFDTADGRILMHCFAGCSIESICSSIGIEVSQLFAGSSESIDEGRNR